ncbi:MAG: DUF3656 domain-containing U32 family peptidase [Eubacteriaceae bacterium]|jgi:putative protease
MKQNRQYKIPELLAPAGTPEAAVAAIAGGADAIYAGLPVFNARMMAENFTTDSFEEMFAMCRTYGVKLYVVVNTLVKDSELADAVRTLAYLDELQVDGVIIQDPGLIRMARTYFPGLKLQVSTQLTVYGVDGVLFFEDLGFNRVVMPREMSIAEAGKIRSMTDTEIKIFGHGALCYAYSGQCRFSSSLGNRSGNRGRCAQPCRKLYELQTEDGKNIKSGYLLSTRDLNTLQAIPQIAEAGIDSIKIEGRLKSPEYVYAVISAYREALDREAAKGKAVHTGADNKTVKGTNLSQTKTETAVQGYRNREELLKAVFSRGFTGGNLFGHDQRLTPDIGKKRGFYIGKTGKRKGAWLEIILNRGITLANGDGIAFGKEEKTGTNISGVFRAPENKARMNEGSGRIWIKPGLQDNRSIQEGEPVYRSLDHRLMKQLKTAASKLPEKKKGQLNLEVSIYEGAPVTGTVTVTMPGNRSTTVCQDADGQNTEFSCEFETDIIPQQARTRALTEEEVSMQLEKTGGTGYTPGRIDVFLGEDLFLPKSELNRIRTTAIETLEQQQVISSWKAEELAADNSPEQMEKGIALKESLQAALTEAAEIGKQEACSTQDTKKPPVLSVELQEDAEPLDYIDAGVDELILPIGRFSDRNGNCDQAESSDLAVSQEKISISRQTEEMLDTIGKLHQAGIRVLLTSELVVNTDRCQELHRHREELQKLLDAADGFLVKNYEMLKILSDFGYTSSPDRNCSRNSFQIETDDSMNLFNVETSRFFSEAGAASGMLSTELNGEEMAELARISAVAPVLNVYGKKLIMTSAYCVFDCPGRDCKNCRNEGRYILDQNGAKYSLRVKNRLNEIRETKPLLLTGEQARRVPAQKLRLVITDESPETVTRLLGYYRGSCPDDNLDDTTDYTSDHQGDSAPGSKSLNRELPAGLKPQPGSFLRGVL